MFLKIGVHRVLLDYKVVRPKKPYYSVKIEIYTELFYYESLQCAMKIFEK